MLKKTTCWTVLIYGFILMCLGYLGYHQAGSKISLYLGVGLGALLALSALLMFARQKFAAYTALFLTLALTVLFGVRYSMTGKGIPAVLAVLSGGMLLFLLAQSAKWKK